MILVSSAVGSKELKPIIRSLGVVCDAVPLEFGDAAFEGNGPEGLMSIGVERKRLHDILQCIDDGRYTGHQRIGMNKAYRKSFLIIEGWWKPHSQSGLLMEGFIDKRGTLAWAYCRPRGQGVMYSKLYRYLISVQLGGVVVVYSKDIGQTCFDVVEMYHYFQKPWRDHKSLLEMQKLVIPTLETKPSLTRRWAACLPGIGTELSSEAERVFRKPIALATADETDWLRLEGVGVSTAQKIVREINR